MDVRPAARTEFDQLARLWFDGWRDAHEAIVPPDLTRVRTLTSFRQRIEEGRDDVRVAGPIDAPLGFCMVKGDELYQLYVAAAARGTGVANALIDDGERLLARRGVSTAFLMCAIGNERAARFYVKRGWIRVGTMPSRLETPEGEFILDVWRYEKTLSALDVGSL